MSDHTQQTMDQMRGKDSLAKIKEIEENVTEPDQDRYADYVERLPASILTNGLGQALAQVLAAEKREKKKGSDKMSPHGYLYSHIEQWLCSEEWTSPYAGKKKLLEAMTEQSRGDYMRAQGETLAWLQWHKKLAVALLKQPESHANE